jgi:hypothetical protein
LTKNQGIEHQNIRSAARSAITPRKALHSGLLARQRFRRMAAGTGQTGRPCIEITSRNGFPQYEIDGQ